MICRKVFELEPEVYYQTIQQVTGNSSKIYNVPNWKKAEEILLDMLNNWHNPKNINIITITMNVPKLEIYYKENI